MNAYLSLVNQETNIVASVICLAFDESNTDELLDTMLSFPPAIRVKQITEAEYATIAEWLYKGWIVCFEPERDNAQILNVG